MTEESRKTESFDNEDDIKVTDRRHFTVEGDPRGELPEEGDEEETRSEVNPAASGEGVESVGTSEGSETGFQHEPIEEPEGVDFTMLINAWVQPALIFLGEVEHPGTGKSEINMEQAKLHIDLLDLLRVKCRGNLTPEENGLLDRVLYQLRMLYMERSDKAGE